MARSRPLYIAMLLGLAGCLPALEDECSAADPCAEGRCVVGVCVPPTRPTVDTGGAPEDVAAPAPDAGVEDAVPRADCTARVESCNGLDDDCDGVTDEAVDGVLSRPCYDGPTDRVGVGLCRAGAELCEAGAWAVCAAQILAEAELCDGDDNDCDGVVDEGLSEACYGGPAQTLDRGICRAGARTCVGGVPSGDCVDQVLPGRDICDGADNDCDGRVDEMQPCTCQAGDRQPCSTAPPEVRARGRCRLGTQGCERGRWGACEGEITPAEEVCNAIDDDCDGAVDESVGGGACRAGLGQCRREGVLVCGPDGLICEPEHATEPQPERCNDRDDDCDGRTDEGFDVGAPCAEGDGRCAVEGFARCADDGEVVCAGPRPPPQAERCNGVDEDCDGRIDEGDAGPLFVACYPGPERTVGVGLCRSGRRLCADGAVEVDCPGAVLPQPELCDGLDNDCDGAVDELADGCACAPGVVRACYGGPPDTEGRGVCAAGERACGDDGRFGACRGAVLPGEEACNGVDDDCDGLLDESAPGAGRVCTSGVGACAREGVLACAAGVLACPIEPGAPAVEVCNGSDDDCDGVADEELADTGQPCVTGVGACAAEGLTGCEPGRGVVCGAEPAAPRPERCNGLDDDCDGAEDEGVRDACGGCAEALPPDTCDGVDSDCDGQIDEDRDALVGTLCLMGEGICAAEGVFACGAGGLVCVAEPSPAGVEVCNGLDDDCNGRVDDEAICPLDNVAAARCVEGECLLDACAPGFVDDDRAVDNGCERGCGPGVERVVARGSAARSARGGGVRATVIVDARGWLRLIRDDRPAVEVSPPDGGRFSWPEIAWAADGWSLVARLQHGEQRGVASVWVPNEGEVEVRRLPGEDVGAPVVVRIGPEPEGGLAIAYLGASAVGAPRHLFLGLGQAVPAPLAGPSDYVTHATAGVALLSDAAGLRIFAPVARGEQTRLRAITVIGRRASIDGEAEAVGAVVGRLSAARSGRSAVVVYVAGGSLHRHAVRLDDQMEVGPRLSLRDGAGVSRGGIARAETGFVVVTAAPDAQPPCGLHVLRFDGSSVVDVPLAAAACVDASLSAGEPAPVLTRLDGEGQIWQADSGCR